MSGQPIKIAAVSSESGHWYDQLGRQVELVEGSKGQPVKPDLRHARKLNLAPGITTVLKVAHREQLVQYRERQAAWAALTLPRVAGETDEDFVARILRDGGQAARTAADQGSNIHGRIEKGIADPYCTDELVLAVRSVLPVVGTPWSCEQSVVNTRYGYGTKADIHNRESNIVLDFKTKDGSVAESVMYAEHMMQLAATRYALGMPTAKVGIVFVSRTQCEASICWAGEDQIAAQWQVFLAQLNLWQLKSNYRPAWANPVY
jgi:hypothetical protein